MKKYIYLFLLTVLSFSCNKEDGVETDPILPTIITTAPTSVTAGSATSGGNITSDGGAAVTVRGICWSTAPNPVTGGNHTTDGSGVGIFATTFSGLAATTTYYIRAYATNAAGTAYGNEISFSTTNNPVALPTVTTSPASAITSNGSTVAGNVVADGGGTITARGICWSTTPGAAITGSHTVTGTGIGNFTAALTGLSAASTYYLRAYATNSAGTAYGNEEIFTTLAASVPADVYVSGYQGAGVSVTHGKYWKNGVPHTVGVTDSTVYVHDVFVSGNDVYTVGNQFFSNGVNHRWSVMLWKNGVANPLYQTAFNSGRAEATSVFVSGTDVYVSGFIINTNGSAIQAVLWKNGVRTNLSTATTTAKALSVFVDGSDVYVAGNEKEGDYFVARYWKNGNPVTLATPGHSANAASIFVSGGDVYVAGTESNGTLTILPRLWKNGVATALSNSSDNGYAHDVFVSGTDVYVTGQEYLTGSTTRSKAKVWKNGVASFLPGTEFAYGTSIAVKGSDVYVAGAEFNGTTYFVKLWKNGIATSLTDGTGGGTATGIFVK